MRSLKTTLIVAFILIARAVTDAEDKVTYVTSLTSTTMPSIQMKDKPLEKVLDELKAKVHDFNFVIHREAGVAADYPVLPAMTLQNVNVDQFLTLIGNEYPNIRITYIPDNSWKFPPLIEVDIKPDSTAAVATTQPAVDPTVVRVYALGDVISARMVLYFEKKVTEKQVTDDILSLIQAALQQVDPQHLPVIKLHQPTNTLIFKGSADQAALLEETLNTLRNTDATRLNEQQRRILDGMNDQIEQLQTELASRAAPSTQPKK